MINGERVLHGGRGGCTRPIIALATAACVIWVAGCASSSDGSASSHTSGALRSSEPSRPNITQLSGSMVVNEKSFPQISDATWKPGYIVPDSSRGARSDCGLLLSGAAHVENSLARAALIGQSRNPMFKVELSLPTDGQLPNWGALVDKCGSFTAGNRTLTIRRASSGQLPSWATAARITIKDDGGEDTAQVIYGNYRGVAIFVQASRKPEPTDDDAAAATTLFNDQVAKLQDV